MENLVICIVVAAAFAAGIFVGIVGLSAWLCGCVIGPVKPATDAPRAKECAPAVRIYISGPMTGYIGFNFAAFNAEAARLRALGYEVCNPAEIKPWRRRAASIWRRWSPTWADHMRADIAALVTCDVVAMLPGWAASRGANLERTVAAALEMRIVMAAEIVDAACVGRIK